MYVDDRVPITPHQAYDGDFWRNRAELTRKKAVSMIDPDMRKRLLKVAFDYDRLGRRADAVQAEIDDLR